MSSVKTALSWVKTLVFSEREHRKREKRAILDKIGELAQNGARTKEMLMSPSEYEFVGFGVNLFYIREDGTKAMLVHPFGFPALIYKHKKSCTLVIASPIMEYNKPIKGTEVAYDKYEQVIGVLG